MPVTNLYAKDCTSDLSPKTLRRIKCETEKILVVKSVVQPLTSLWRTWQLSDRGDPRKFFTCAKSLLVYD